MANEDLDKIIIDYMRNHKQYFSQIDNYDNAMRVAKQVIKDLNIETYDNGLFSEAKSFKAVLRDSVFLDFDYFKSKLVDAITFINEQK